MKKRERAEEETEKKRQVSSYFRSSFFRHKLPSSSLTFSSHFFFSLPVFVFLLFPPSSKLMPHIFLSFFFSLKNLLYTLGVWLGGLAGWLVTGWPQPHKVGNLPVLCLSLCLFSLSFFTNIIRPPR